MAANKAEFDQKLVDLTQEIRASTESAQHQPLDRISRRRSRPLRNPQKSQWLAQRLLSPWLKCHKRVEVVIPPAVMEVTSPIPKCQRRRFKAVNKWAIVVNTSRHWGQKRQQTGSVKDYSEKFLQLIVKVGNNVTEKDKLRRYVEGLKDEIRTVIRVGMVDGRYTIFAQVKRAAEALDFELWRSRRKTNPAGSSTTW
jgi:Retrotransposon gag protein